MCSLALNIALDDCKTRKRYYLLFTGMELSEPEIKGVETFHRIGEHAVLKTVLRFSKATC